MNYNLGFARLHGFGNNTRARRGDLRLGRRFKPLRLACLRYGGGCFLNARRRGNLRRNDLHFQYGRRIGRNRAKTGDERDQERVRHDG